MYTKHAPYSNSENHNTLKNRHFRMTLERTDKNSHFPTINSLKSLSMFLMVQRNYQIIKLISSKTYPHRAQTY